MVNPVKYSQDTRVGQRDLYPRSVKTKFFDPAFIATTADPVNGPFSTPNNTSLIVQSIVSVSAGNAALKLGAVPYCIVFFQGSAAIGNIIGADITGSGYAIKGPFCMPDFSPHATNSPLARGGSDGNNLVFITELFNNTGNTQNIYYITDTRYIQGKSSGVKATQT